MNAWALRPSFAPVWGHCSGAVMASMHRPNIETDDTRAGTAAHWVVSETIKRHLLKGVLHPPHCDLLLDEVAPNGVVIDEDHIQAAQVMVDEVLSVAGDDKARLLIEQSVKMPAISPHNGGTLDAALWLPERRVLFLWDYKHGHRECTAEENLQLIDYCEGLIEEYAIIDIDVTVVFRIVQPRCYRNGGPVSEWVVKMSDLRGYFNQLQAKAHDAFNNPSLCAGTHCRDCPAVLPCSASRGVGYQLIDLARQPYAMDAMTGRDMAVERRVLSDGLQLIKARLEALDDELKQRIAAGEADTGLSLQGEYGRLEWTVPPEHAVIFAQQFGVDIRTAGVLTPTQASDAAPKEIKAQFKAALDLMTKRPSKGLKLVDAKNSIAARAFAKHNNKPE